MNLLEKIGKLIGTGTLKAANVILKIVTPAAAAVDPAAGAVLGVLDNWVELAITGEAQLSAAFAAVGSAATPSAKVAALQPFIQEGLTEYFALKLPSAKIKDQAAFEAGCQAIGGGIIQTLQSLGD